MTRIETPAFRRAITEPARDLARIYAQAGCELRLAGGAVRDALIGATPKDIDFASDATPEESVALLVQAGVRVIETGLQHGTVTAVHGGESFEVTTLRTDVACHGRHAEVAFVRSFEQDAARRDLTINAMFAGIDGTLYDFHGGVLDLEKRVVRFVGDPAQRIREDYLRILRYFRFRARFGPAMGGTAVDMANLDAIQQNRAGLGQISPERVWSELRRILAGPTLWQQLSGMAETGILQVLGLQDLDLIRLSRAKTYALHPETLLGAAARDEAAANALADQLRLSNAERALMTYVAGTIGQADAPLSWFQRQLTDGTPLVHAQEALRALHRPTCALQLADCEVPVFPVTGKDLLAAGHAPGPAMGRELARLKRLWQESGYTLSQERLLEMGVPS
ncbi:CCA tRNA nucleotidyltransferase [Rhodovibrio sodomensis]|nr:CCA tRNA nucleotidyltransferase [Rhodovibrio sodomensis]